MSRSDEQVAAVRGLYERLAKRDAKAVAAHVDEVFADDVVLDEPPSLPWGGTHEGRRRVGRIFEGMAAAPPGKAPIDPERIEIANVAAGDDEVAVELRFPLLTKTGATVPSGAVEWFSFSEGRIVAIRASYFDTAAYLGVEGSVR